MLFPSRKRVANGRTYKRVTRLSVGVHAPSMVQHAQPAFAIRTLRTSQSHRRRLLWLPTITDPAETNSCRPIKPKKKETKEKLPRGRGRKRESTAVAQLFPSPAQPITKKRRTQRERTPTNRSKMSPGKKTAGEASKPPRACAVPYPDG